MRAVPGPLLNNGGIVHLEKGGRKKREKKEAGVGRFVYQFSLSSLFHSPTSLFTVDWKIRGGGTFRAQQVVPECIAVG